MTSFARELSDGTGIFYPFDALLIGSCISRLWRAKPCTVWGGQAEGSGSPLLKGDETGVAPSTSWKPNARQRGIGNEDGHSQSLQNSG